MKNAKIIGLIVSLIPLLVFVLMPEIEGLSRAGAASLCVLITVILLLLTEALPIPISCVLGMTLLIIFKAVPAPGGAFTGFTNPIVWFVFVSFGISYSISSTNLSKRMLMVLMRTFGKNVKTIILAIMLCTGVLSSIMSNVAAVMIFIAVAMTFLEIYDDEQDKRRAGRTLMIALPIASMLGGMITPAGSSLNLLCLSWLEQITGLRVQFVQWMAMGIPLFVVLLPLAWLIVIKINKPVDLPQEKIQAFILKNKIDEPFSFKEKYVLVVILGMFVCWVIGSWIPVFNVTVVAAVGVALMFLPRIEIMTWNDLNREVSWPAIILLGSIISVGNVLVQTEASTWFVSLILPTSLSLPAIVVVFIVAILIFLLLIIIPVAPALISVLAVPLVGLAAAAGFSPVLLIMTMGLTVCNCFLLPFDTVPLITYMKGYFTKPQLAKTAVWVQLINAALVAIWLPVIVNVLGL